MILCEFVYFVSSKETAIPSKSAVNPKNPKEAANKKAGAV